MDPLASDYTEWNSYNYAFNNPLRFVDPTGMGPDDETLNPAEQGGMALFNAFTTGMENMIKNKLTQISASLGLNVFGIGPKTSASISYDKDGNTEGIKTESILTGSSGSPIASETIDSEGKSEFSVLGGTIETDGEKLKFGIVIPLKTDIPVKLGDESVGDVGGEIKLQEIYNVKDYDEAAEKSLENSMKPKAIIE